MHDDVRRICFSIEIFKCNLYIKAKKLCSVFIIHATGICLLLLLSLLKNITVKILHNLRTKSETKQLQPER